MKRLTLDFETQSPVDLRKCGAFEYSMHPETRVTCLGFKDHGKGNQLGFFDYHKMETPFKKLPERFQKHWIERVLDGWEFSAHNAFFEQCIYNNVLVPRFGWPRISPNKWRCTAAKAAACALPRNLAGAGEAVNLKTKKDPEGHRAMLKTCKPTSGWNAWFKATQSRRPNAKTQKVLAKGEPPKYWTPETAPDTYAVLYKYCKIDVLSEEELDSVLPDLHPDEQKAWFADQRMNFKGIRVDVAAVQKIIGILESEKSKLREEIDELTAGIITDATQRNAIMEFLAFEGIEMPNLRAHTVEEYLTSGKVNGDHKRILEIRKGMSKASTAKYLAFMRRAGRDGIAREILLFHAASTGRWGGVGLQPQNFPRGIDSISPWINEAIDRILTCDVGMLKLLYGEDLMPLFSSVLRGMFIPRKGKKLFVGDWNAIETRVLWWLADHKVGLKIFKDGRNPYLEFGKKVFGREITKEEALLYLTAKAGVLGLGYQMGAPKFVTSAWDVYRAKVTDETAVLSVKTYREVHKPVVTFWKNLEQATIFAIEKPGQQYKVGRLKFIVERGFLWVTLPSGRRLAYKDARVQWEETPWGASVKKVSFMAVNSKTKQWVRETIYGGKWAENFVQAVARDLLRDCLKKLEWTSYEALMHSHDEAVTEAGPEGTEEGLKELMEAVPAWAEGLPLKAEIWSNTRYRK